MLKEARQSTAGTSRRGTAQQAQHGAAHKTATSGTARRSTARHSKATRHGPQNGHQPYDERGRLLNGPWQRGNLEGTEILGNDSCRRAKPTPGKPPVIGIEPPGNI